MNIDNTVKHVQQKIEPCDVSFFNCGYYVHNISDTQTRKRVESLANDIATSSTMWLPDKIEQDSLMPEWSRCGNFSDPQAEEMLDVYIDIIKSHSSWFDDRSRIIEMSLQCGVHGASTFWHTDYYDTHRSDAFILAYPVCWDPSWGANLEIGLRDLGGDIVNTTVFNLTPHKVLFINNMNPFFVHRVQMLLNAEQNFNRFMLLIGWKRNAVR